MLRKRALPLRALLFVSIVTACARKPELDMNEPAHLSVTTDKHVYVAEPFHYARPWHTYRYRANIVTTFRNTSSKPVFLQRCYPRDTKPMFELLPVVADDSWDNYSTNWACVGHDQQIVVLPGGMRVDTLTIEGPNGHSSTGKVFGRIEGTFRIGLLARECPDELCALVDSLRFSNSFKVHLAVGIPPRDASMAGCYVMGNVDWMEPPPMAAPPSRFRLYNNLSSPASDSRDNVRPRLQLGDSSVATWVQSSPDSLTVTWRNGFSGYRLHLRPDGGLLFGSLEIFSVEAPLRDRFTDAVARRANCDHTFDFVK